MTHRGRRLGLPLLAGLLLAAIPVAADEANQQRVARLRELVATPSPHLPAATARPAPGLRWSEGRCRPRTGVDSASATARLRTRAAVRDASLRFAVPSRLIEAVIRHESNGDPNAVSHAGAEGLMQLMPATARTLGVVCSFDPRENVLAGTRYLRRLYERFGSWRDALAAYNAGPARVERGSLPAETRRYVRRVLESWRPGRIGRVADPERGGGS